MLVMDLKKWNSLKHSLIILLMLMSSASLPCFAQKADIQYCNNPEFNTLVADYINFSIPIISVKELHDSKEEFVILDAREKAEYGVSHIPNSLFIGYDNPDFNVLKDIPKETPIIIYCSIGYRSEKIGSRLEKLGYTKVRNLYGSIFEWVNQGYPVTNNTCEETKKIHGYNKSWSRWITNKKMIITY